MAGIPQPNGEALPNENVPSHRQTIAPKALDAGANPYAGLWPARVKPPRVLQAGCERSERGPGERKRRTQHVQKTE